MVNSIPTRAGAFALICVIVIAFPWGNPLWAVSDGDNLAVEAADTPETVPVTVHLVSPGAVAGFRDWTDAAASAVHRGEVALLQDAVLTTADLAFEIVPRQRFENMPAFSADVTAEGLERLRNDPRVAHVELVTALELHTKQGLALVEGVEMREAFSGEGVAIAVCDSGIDYGHAQLGGGGSPNAKIIGGYDFGDSDADPLDENGHGTQVAGIAAGELLSSGGGDYDGGVAPDAKIYALKVTAGDSLTVDSDALAAAWDWCVSHRNDDPANPIRVINTSLGGGRSNELCDDEYPSLAQAATNAVNAGIVVIASSGNDGYCDSLAIPACLSNVISVGAVYDDMIGPVVTCIDPFGCTGRASGACSSSYLCDDLSPIADLMACYSNTSRDLTVLAPGEYATSPALGGGFDDFGGTSAAAPYVAGAVAAMFDAAEELMEDDLTPAIVRSLLVMTGEPRIDPESRLMFPRIDLENAILSMGPAAGCQGIDDLLVLTANGENGIGNGHEVAVSTAGPLALYMDMPLPEGDAASFCVHLNAGYPNAATIETLPRRLGHTCFEFLLTRGAKPLAVFNNLGRTQQIGSSEYFGEPGKDPAQAPVEFLSLPAGDSANLPVGSRWTVQGAISNPDASARVAVSVTNAVLITITD